MSTELTSAGLVKSNYITDSATNNKLKLQVIPSTYTPLQYIIADYSVGAAIDTGWLVPIHNWTTEVEYYYNQPNTSDHSVAGLRENNLKMLNHYNNYYESTVSIPTSYYSINQWVKLIYNFTDTTKTVMLKSNIGTYVGSTSYTPASGTSPNTLPIGAFRETNSTSFSWFFNGYIKYYNIYEKGVLVRSFKPVKRNSDSVVGMYDIINGVFYPSATSGAFTAGPAILDNSSIIATNFIEY